MSAVAVFMMAITILLVWGGLVASIVALRVLPVPEASPEIDAEGLEHLAQEHPRHGSVPDNI
ncbi:methionine/alanine import family NSS transporter small subunit [Schaalia sp. 19OD2882]|uniref:methionine/alanine import family NSS transporter small subunit n=1 Tax=Schaalia sp. 19OD2882 TaxID=2794089 RepID=UPI001C1EC735|nr:methionine/alanine import family NSS transporter small subunit [Schaalia sp. 19OD2882]QWW20422.1 methionine/alanine import family NSS transporter small subunit [Schaalia sp. 19OD2882]